jgi:hypothetical protein
VSNLVSNVSNVSRASICARRVSMSERERERASASANDVRDKDELLKISPASFNE